MFDRTKPYNDLPDLPISEEIIDAEILKKWGITSRILADLNRNILRIPNPSMLINTLALQEAKVPPPLKIFSLPKTNCIEQFPIR